MLPETPNVLSKLYVFDPRPRFSFRITAKRYWTEERVNGGPMSDAQGDVVTLIFAHGTGFHKELWEPSIKRLFEKQHTLHFRIGDMWSIDAPNHGDATVLNEGVLPWGYKTFSWEDYARSIHAFLMRLGNLQPADVDFSKRKLVAIGHCYGAVSLIISTTFFPLLKFSSMHIIEPFLGSTGKNWDHLIERSEGRRDIWASKEEAYRDMKGRHTWRNWDDRVFRIYVEDGLRPLPTTKYPDRSDSLTLKCTKQQEAATCRDDRSFTIAYRVLCYILKDTPTHITYGDLADFLPVQWKQEVLHNASGGIGNFASVIMVPNAGHLIVQTHPDVIADVILQGLIKSHPSSARGRL